VRQLLDLPGCAHLTAAKLVAETADITGFATSDRYAAYAGTAPIPASSGTIHRHRLARGGNRQLNAAIHRIALTQIRIDGPGHADYLRRQADGKTKKEAIRLNRYGAGYKSDHCYRNLKRKSCRR